MSRYPYSDNKISAVIKAKKGDRDDKKNITSALISNLSFARDTLAHFRVRINLIIALPDLEILTLYLSYTTFKNRWVPVYIAGGRVVYYERPKEVKVKSRFFFI